MIVWMINTWKKFWGELERRKNVSISLKKVYARMCDRMRVQENEILKASDEWMADAWVDALGSSSM